MAHLVTKSTRLGLTVFRPYIFKDYRGEYTETYNQKEVLPDYTFIQDSVILSTKGVLRGYHGDNRTTKLITCLQGAFQIVVVCIDPTDTERFLIPESFVLDDKERLTLVVPPNFVNAHQCLTDTCLFFYKQDTLYKSQKYQYTIKWDSIGIRPGKWERNGNLNIGWPQSPVLSSRDMHDAKFVNEYINQKTNTLRAPEEVNK